MTSYTAICMVVIVACVAIFVRAITSRRQARHRAREKAYLETLSERLPAATSRLAHANQLLRDRASLENAIRLQLTSSPESPADTIEPFSLIYLEVLDWQPILDRVGPQTGESLLRSIKQRLRSLLRPQDSLAQIAPAGFAFLVRGAGLKAQQELLGAIEPQLTSVFNTGRHQLKLRCGMGASRFPDAGNDAATLLNVAMRLHYMFGAENVSGMRSRHA